MADLFGVVSNLLAGTPIEGSPAETPPAPASEPAKEEAATGVPDEQKADETKPDGQDQVDDEEWDFSEDKPKEEAAEKVEPGEEKAPLVEEAKPVEEVKEVKTKFDDPKTERERKIYGAFKALEGLAKPVAEGGIGFRPTPEQIKDYYLKASDLELMSEEYNSGEPEKVENFLLNWLNPDNPSSEIAAEKFFDVVKDTPYFAKAAVPFANYLVEELYENFPKQATDKERAYLANLARGLESYLTGGKFREIDPALVEKGLIVNPIDSTRKELEETKKRLTEIESKAQQESQAKNSQALNNTVESSVVNDINQALSVVKDQIKQAGLKDSYYLSVAKDFAVSAQKLAEQDLIGMRRFNSARERAIKSGKQEDILAARDAYRAIMRPAVRSLRVKYISGVSARIKADSNARHEDLSKGASKTGGVAVSAPPTQSVVGVKRQPGQTHKDFLENLVRGAISPLGS